MEIHSVSNIMEALEAEADESGERPTMDKRRTKTEQIEHNFTYHAPQEGQPERYVVLRDAAKALAYLIYSNTQESREQSLALTKLEEAIFWANAGIARHG